MKGETGKIGMKNGNSDYESPNSSISSGQEKENTLKNDSESEHLHDNEQNENRNGQFPNEIRENKNETEQQTENGKYPDKSNENKNRNGQNLNGRNETRTEENEIIDNGKIRLENGQNGKDNEDNDNDDIPIGAEASTYAHKNKSRKEIDEMQINDTDSDHETALLAFSEKVAKSQSMQKFEHGMRSIRSHPNMSTKNGSSNYYSLGNLPCAKNSDSNKRLKDGGVIEGSIATLSSHSSGRQSQKMSQDSLNRSNSKNNCNVSEGEKTEKSQHQSSPGLGDDEYEDEEGAHDTITSLAGAHMLQKYRKTIRGSRGGSVNSLNQRRLEDLFSEEPLLEEEAKEDVVEEDEHGKEVLVPEDEDIFVPPDGGYGWFVALGAFISLFWTAGMIKSYGVIFAEILIVFPDSSVTLASWIPASMTTLALAMAPVTSALCQKYNCRYVTFAGSIICFIGISASCFAPNVEVLFFTFGILTGIGVGLSTTPGIILTARYFDSRRSIANAFCLSGTAAGSFTLPFLIGVLLNAYGFRGAVLVLGACMLHVCIGAALYRPLAVHVTIMKKYKLQEMKSQKTTVVNPQDLVPPIIQSVNLHSNRKENLPSLHQHVHHNHPNHPLHHQVHHMHHSNIANVPYSEAYVHHRLNSINESSSFHMPSMDNISVTSSMSANSARDSAADQSNHFKQSMTSIPSSLPPNWEHRNYGSNTSSREELNWPEPSPKLGRNLLLHSTVSHDESHEQHFSFNHHPLGASGGVSPTPKQLLRSVSARPGSSSSSRQDEQHSRNNMKETVSLRQIYFHQIGSQLSLYRDIILGKKPSKMYSSNNCSGNNRKPNVSSSVSRHGSERSKDKTDSKPKKSSSSRLGDRRRSSSLMFSLEDMTTDSTSVLKDFRHPSITSSIEVGPTKRVVTLGRSVSCATSSGRSSVTARPQSRNSGAVVKKRTRYLSEGDELEMDPKNKTSSRFRLVPYKETDGKDVKVNSSDKLNDHVKIRNASGDDKKFDSDTKNDDEEKTDKEKDIDSTIDAENNVPKSTVADIIRKYLDISLVKEPLFVMMALSVMTMSVGVPHVLFFLPSYMSNHGFSISEASVILGTCSVFDLLGRIIFAIILDMKLIPKHVGYAIMIFLSGFSVIMLPFANDFVSLMITMACYGIGIGSWFLMVPLLLAEYLGVENIASSYGLVRLFQSVMNLCGPIVGGIIKDKTGSFSGTFYFMGSIMCIGSVAVLCQPLFEKASKAKRLEEHANKDTNESA